MDFNTFEKEIINYWDCEDITNQIKKMWLKVIVVGKDGLGFEENQWHLTAECSKIEVFQMKIAYFYFCVRLLYHLVNHPSNSNN